MLVKHEFFLVIDRPTVNQLGDNGLEILIENHFGKLPVQTKMVRKIVDNEHGYVYCYVDLFETP